MPPRYLPSAMPTVLPVDLLRGGEPYEFFVHQRRGLERVARRAAHSARCVASEFVVEQ